MASTVEISQFDGTGDYTTWKFCLRAYAMSKRLRMNLVGRGIPIVGDGDDAAAQKLLLDEYHDKSAQMHGIIVQHTVVGSGPWVVCAEYSREIEEVADGEGVYSNPALMELLDEMYAGATSRIEKLRYLRRFFRLTQDGTTEEYAVTFAALCCH